MSVTVFSLQQLFLILVRVLTVIMLMPVIGTRRCPAVVKVGLALGVSAMLWAVRPRSGQAFSVFALAAATAQELLLGLVTGFAARLTFTGLEMAATYLGLQSGLRMATQLGTGAADVFQDSGSALEQIYLAALALTFLAVDGHHWIILGLDRTLTLVPVGQFALSPLAPERLMTVFAASVTTALSLALPIMGTLLLTDLSLGIVARAVPQVNVFLVGAPLKIALAIAGMALALPWTVNYIADKFTHLFDEMLLFVAR